MTALRDLDAADRARLAALLLDDVGQAAVNQHRAGITVDPPAPGVAVLACRCGAVLDAADLRRQPIGCSTAVIPRITCSECAA